MSFTFSMFRSLALSLSLISADQALPQPLASTLLSLQSSDEETVRGLTERYGVAIAAGDLETLRQLWNPASPHMAARLGFYKGFFSNPRFEFIRMNVTRLEITGDKAISHLTSDDRQLDTKAQSAGGIRRK